MSQEKEYTITIRLPKVQEEYVKLMNETYGFSCNNLVKMALLLHQTQFGQQTQSGINLIPPTVSNEQKPKKPKRYQTDTGDDTKNTDPSRAPSIISNFNKTYSIINNVIIFLNKETEDAWLSFKKYRKEIKKPFTKTSEVFQQRYIDRVLKHESEQQLVERWHNSIRNNWNGFIFPNEVLGDETNSNEQYSEEDL